MVAIAIISSAAACGEARTILAPGPGALADRRAPTPQVSVEIDADVVVTEPLVVRSGFLTVHPFQGADAVFEGRGFRIEARGIELGVVDPVCPCAIPSEASIGSFFAGSFLGNGPARVAEEQFDGLFYGGQIEIVGEPATLNRGRAHGVLIAPIRLTASLQGYLRSALIPDPPFPSIDVRLTGQGSVRIDFAFFDDGGLRYAEWQAMTFTFRPGPRLITD